jgi:AraC-like DNA-binding protein
MARFLAAANVLRLHVWRMRPDESVVYCNERFTAYTGLTVDQLHHGGWMVPVRPADVERVRTIWEDARSHLRPFEVQACLRGRDGIYRCFLCRGAPVLERCGHIVEWIGTNTIIDVGHYLDVPVRDAVRRLVRDSHRREAALTNLFEQVTGSSLHEFLIRTRVHHAARLIERGEKIEAVALAMGYRSKKNFYYPFRRVFGTTPSQYRRHPAGCGVCSSRPDERVGPLDVPSGQRRRV